MATCPSPPKTGPSLMPTVLCRGSHISRDFDVPLQVRASSSSHFPGRVAESPCGTPLDSTPVTSQLYLPPM
ncbi:hypothetical protein BGW80DRAFT_1366374 [Lactifluus volemus]|nr:hypothetical protein BGW80DRAFT_1366374 [Lactifluus volemus]